MFYLLTAVEKINAHTSSIRHAVFLHNSRIVSVSDDLTMRVWDRTSGQVTLLSVLSIFRIVQVLSKLGICQMLNVYRIYFSGLKTQGQKRFFRFNCLSIHYWQYVVSIFFQFIMYEILLSFKKQNMILCQIILKSFMFIRLYGLYGTFKVKRCEFKKGTNHFFARTEETHTLCGKRVQKIANYVLE